MSEANPQQEPSMEEILASIRRIISEDDKPEGAAADAKPSDDVLELTEVAEEEGEPEAEAEAAPVEEDLEEPAQEAEEELSIDDVLDEAEAGDDELELRDEVEPHAEADTPAPAAAVPPTAPAAGLLAAQTEAAATGSLSALVAAVDRAHGGTTLGDGNRTLEDLVKELMRPMVKEWLDQNLPRLTERLVRREIERLARNAEDD